jgi:phosphoglycolate phosphatase
VRPTVLLYDIDGTLVTTGGAGRRAMERAFERACGRADACAGFRFDGMTDRAIARAGLTAAGAEVTEDRIDALLAAYLAALDEEVQRVSADRYRVHPGIERSLEEAARAGAAIGLGTGNVRGGARIKLGRVGLYERFAFGGFGCDHEDRPTLLRTGALRGAERLGVALEACRVVVVGDTPRDVAAAQEIGAESVAVGTGSFRTAELWAAGATFAFEHLDTAEALGALLEGRVGRP